MGYKTVESVMKYSRSKGSARLLLMVLATHADEGTLECYPGRDLLCQETAMSHRNVTRALKELETLNEVTLSRGNGRGNQTAYKLSISPEKGDKLSPFIKTERVTNPPKRVTDLQERVTKVAIKGDKSGLHIGRTVMNRHEPSKNHVGATAPDARTQHVAIQTCRQVAKAYPPKELWDKIIQVLGDKPNTALLVECRAEWVERGYNRASWKWATEWYATGVPARTVNGQPKQGKAAYVGAAKPTKEKQVNAEDLAFMEEYIDGLIAANDFAHLADEYDRIVRDGGAKADWEIRVVAYYELHRDEPATPEQVASLKASISALVPKGGR